MVLRAWRSHTHGIQNSFRISCRDTEKHAGGAFRFSSPLLPITKRGRADSEQPGKLLLSEPQVPVNGQDVRVINAE